MGQPIVRRVLWDDAGGVVVEFVALMPAFVLLTFFIIEIMVALFTVGTVEKAAQLGARLAVVSDVAATGLSPTNSIFNSTVTPGSQCSNANTCTDFGTLTCVANNNSGCVTTAGTYPCTDSTGTAATTPIGFIVCRMNAISGVVTKQYVTISYTYIGLGFATGPVVPSVKLTISGVPYNSVLSSIVNKVAGANALTILPTISVTLTSEDLSSAGA